MTPAERIKAACAKIFAGRRVVVAGGVLPGMTPLVEELRTAGVEAMLLVPIFPGTGAIPEGPDISVCLDAMSTEPVEGATATFRAEERVFATPPASVLEAIHDFASAPIVLAPAFSAVRTLGPWAVYGARRPEWVALEDKTVSDALFDAAGVAHPPNVVVRAAEADGEPGTVWSGDARDGFNGGAEYVRWVRDDATRASARAFFAAHCEYVRIAPFVEGIPCSIHGIVTAGDVAVLRPVEMVVLRVDNDRGLRYAGASTYYDPPADVRADMRAAARRLGACLRDRVGFRGAFTIDGIVSVDGWVATECNPRPGAGIAYAASVRPDLVMTLMHRMIVEGALDDLDVAQLEREVVELADARRWGGGWTPVAVPITDTVETMLVGDQRGYARATPEATADASLLVGPSPSGGFVRFVPDAARTPAGPSIAERALAAFAFADQEFGTALGPMCAPLSVR